MSFCGSVESSPQRTVSLMGRQEFSTLDRSLYMLILVPISSLSFAHWTNSCLHGQGNHKVSRTIDLDATRYQASKSEYHSCVMTYDLDHDTSAKIVLNYVCWLLE